MMRRPGLRHCAPWLLAALAGLVGIGAWAGAVGPVGATAGRAIGATVRNASSGLPAEVALGPAVFDRAADAMVERSGPFRAGGPAGVLAAGAVLLALAGIGRARPAGRDRIAITIRSGPAASRAPPARA